MVFSLKAYQMLQVDLERCLANFIIYNDEALIKQRHFLSKNIKDKKLPTLKLKKENDLY